MRRYDFNFPINYKKIYFFVKFFLFFILFNIFILEPNYFLFGADPKNTEENLKKIREDLEKKQKDLEKAKKEAINIKKEVVNISSKLTKSIKNIKNIERNINSQKKDYELYKEKLKAEKLKEKYYRQILKKEIQFLYYQKYINNNDFLKTLNAFFSDAEFYKNLNETKTLESFLNYNKKKVYLTREYQTAFAQTQEKIENQLNILLKNKENQQKNREKFNKEQKIKQSQLKNIVENQKLYEKQIKELSETAKKMEELLISLTKNKKIEISKNSELVKEFGYINQPVSGKIIVKYGKNKHDKYDTYHICNGIEIQTSGSATVKSVYDGKVVFRDRFSSYGNTVIIEHRKQVFTVYAYLSSFNVKKDQLVSKGTIIGNTGISAVKNVNALYFEVRLNGIAIDPEIWIK